MPSAETRERIAEEFCGDWPAPCNCDDPDTHDGAVPPDVAQFLYSRFVTNERSETQ